MSHGKRQRTIWQSSEICVVGDNVVAGNVVSISVVGVSVVVARVVGASVVPAGHRLQHFPSTATGEAQSN